MTERQFLIEMKQELEDTECTFWACPGPRKPDTPMATCSVCHLVHKIRARLRELTAANKAKRVKR